MNLIEDFTSAQLWTVRQILDERWEDDKIEYKLADSEVRLFPADKELAQCPIIMWQVKNCNYVVIKSGINKFRCQFFYRSFQQYSTEKKEYDNIGDCIISMLKAQLIHQEKNEK
ncbi:MAG: hypothetical protein DRQ51_04530 [Gammaproteobacteria bacterium]|nr:MAG: hypothetical protein DRQ51_04530 [Gammaproteobacteria bacterium]